MATDPKGHAIVLTVAYDGRPFAGFAVQTNARTVGGELEGAIREMDPRAGKLVCVSRTDAGVHARAQVAAFDTTAAIDPRGWVLGLLQHLPREISVVRAAVAPKGYDPRGSARWKRYRYCVLRSELRDPFHEGRAWRVGEWLNLETLENAARRLEGRHDFRAFRGAADEREDTVREIFRIRTSESPEDPRVLRIDFEGDRFLYRMVRILVGTMVDVARRRLEVGAVQRGLLSGRREDVGMTAPAHGLCLEHVEISDRFDQFWPPRRDGA